MKGAFVAGLGESFMVRSILAAVVFWALPGVASFAQDPEVMGKLSPQEHRSLMPVHARILAELKKQDAELEPLLATMNSAPVDKRTDAMTAVLRKLIEQRKAMTEEIASHLDR